MVAKILHLFLWKRKGSTEVGGGVADQSFQIALNNCTEFFAFVQLNHVGHFQVELSDWQNIGDMACTSGAKEAGCASIGQVLKNP